MSRAQQLGMVIIPILLIAYAMPVILATIFSFFGALNGDTEFGKWFVSLLASPDTALNLFHKVLLPITAGVTVATMWQGRNAAWTGSMVIGLVLVIVACIYLLVLFGITDVQRNLWQPAGNPKVTTDDQVSTLASAFVGRVQETLGVYLLILLGLEAIPKQPNTP